MSSVSFRQSAAPPNFVHNYESYITGERDSSQRLDREPLSKDEVRAEYELCPNNITTALTRTWL